MKKQGEKQYKYKETPKDTILKLESRELLVADLICLFIFWGG